MNVIACDDNPAVLEEMTERLGKIKRVDSVRVCGNWESLQAEMEKEPADLVIMDILHLRDGAETPADGIDYAYELNCRFPQLRIIYMTGYNDRYSQSIFLKPVNVDGYLVKPVDQELLSRFIDLAWEKLEAERRKKLVFLQRKRPVTLSFHEIRYMESRGHSVVIFTGQSEYICHEKIDAIQARLDTGGGYFLRCHQSFLVNMEYIRRLENGELILEEAKRIPISKRRYADTRLQYFEYLGREWE